MLQEKMTMKNISEHFNCSLGNVHCNLIRFGIPRRSREDVRKLFLGVNYDLSK